MLLRRIAPAVLALTGLAACEPEVGYKPGANTQTIDYAVFDLSASPPQIPQPNDLALAQAASIPGAQGELLRVFAAPCPGSSSPLPCGFPNDQEVAVTIDFVHIAVDQNSGALTRSKPDLDFGSIRLCTALGQTNCNLAVIALPASQGAPPTFPDIEAPDANSYATNGDHGTLTLRRKLHDVPSGAPPATISTRAWDAGVHYLAVVRGGPSGVTVNGGSQLYPQPAMYILEQGKDLSRRENQGLIPGNSAAEKAANAALLNQIQSQYQLGPYLVIETEFPRTQIATMTTFQIAPKSTVSDAQPVIDASAGTVPLPSNLLLDGSTLPDDPFAPATNARVANQPSFGPLGPGLASLDGFSTTAMLLVPVSSPILVATGAGPTSAFTNNVFLWDLSDPNNPVLVDPATYDDLLPDAARQQVSAGVWASPLVGIQPAAASKLSTSKPLKEATEYAFIVTNRIKSLPSQKPLGRPTVASILLFDNPVYTNGKSQLAGVSDAQAKSLERSRAQIAKVLPKLQALPSPQTTMKADIALAYTFRTQTITTPALQLAAAPYGDANKSKLINVLSMTALTPSAAFTKYGVDPAIVPSTDVDEFIDAVVPTSNLLDPISGAFKKEFVDGTQTPPTEPLNVLVAVPKVASLTACPAPNAALNCAPLVVFHHGLNGGRAQMLLGANALAKRGFVVAAIDAPKHGDRAFCKADSECASGGTCTPIGPPGTQGDTTPPGQCTTALKKNPVLCVTSNCTTTATDGVAVASGNYLLSGNLFRFRDTLRQDILDNSNLILALSRPPTLPATTNPNPLSAELLANGRNLVLDGRVFWEGQSLGAILGTINTAVNPRISESVLNVGGGTFVDIAVSSPAFMDALLAVLGSLNPPISPGTPAFLQFIQVAKWVIDPAEPINFAGHLLGDTAHPTLPNLLAGNAPQGAKSILGQMATCDAVVPNPFNALLYTVAGLGPLSATTATLTVYRDTNQASTTATCPVVGIGTPGTVDHGFLLNYGLKFPTDSAAAQISADAQAHAADFLVNPTTNLPPPLDQKP